MGKGPTKRTLARWPALFAALLLTGGCAFSPQLQRVAVDHDQMVADTEDELMLRNILRARYRYPLHFTTITTVNGDAQLSLGAGVGGSFPGTSSSRSFGADGGRTGSSTSNAASSYSPSMSGAIQTRPSFQAAVLANEKFERGIQQPTKPELIAYYLDAGWRDELLIALFIERLDIIDVATKRRIGSIHNDPDDVYGFQSVICNFALRTYKVDDRTKLASGSEIFDPRNLATLDALDRVEAVQRYVALLKDEKVSLDDGDIRFRSASVNTVGLVRSRDRCARATASASKRDWIGRNPDARLAKGEIRNGLPLVDGRDLVDPGVFRFDGDRPAVPTKVQADYLVAAPGAPAGAAPQWREVTLELHFRSAQAIIYFLGEYLRVGPAAYQLPREFFQARCGAADDKPVRHMRWLLRVLEGGDKGAVDTRFLGRRWYVPAEAEGGADRCTIADGEESRSLQVITLVEQMLNLNKSADQLPTSLSITAFP
jgi:hypothetical protein